MPRIREVALDGLSFKISPLTYDEVDEYIKIGKEMVARDPAPPVEEWAMRTLTTVCIALNKADPEGKWDPKKLTSELDMVMIHRIYDDFLVMSGLVAAPRGQTAPRGEEAATSISR